MAGPIEDHRRYDEESSMITTLPAQELSIQHHAFQDFSPAWLAHGNTPELLERGTLLTV
jgi:hypothetical protein